MCGLVGIAGDTSGAWKDVYTELLLFDSVRGMHSTGAGFVGRHNEAFQLAKRPGHPFNLFETVEFDDYMETKNPVKVILGHNRYATIGEKTEANAHPFAFEQVMGMHNGTLDKWCLKDLPDADKYGTDSEAIFASINERGVKATMALVTGAWALVWYDRKAHTLNFLRNGRRPLHYCYSEDRCTLIWASEMDMLKYVLARRNKKVEGDQFFTTTENIMYSWHIPVAMNKKLDGPEQQTVEGRAFTYVPFKETGTGKKHGKGKTSGTSTVYYPQVQTPAHQMGHNIIPFDKRSSTSHFRPPYKDPHGSILNKEKFTALVGEGCCFCGSNEQEWGEFIHLMGTYTGKNTPYACEECFNDAELYEYSQYAV